MYGNGFSHSDSFGIIVLSLLSHLLKRTKAPSSVRDMSIDSDHSDSEGDGERGVDLFALQSELSPETLAALMTFLPTRSFVDDPEDSREAQAPAVCVAYTAKDVSVIADTFKRIALRNADAEDRLKAAAESRVLLPLEASGISAADALARDGVARMNGVLSAEACDRLLSFVNAKLSDEITSGNAMTQATGFGNVLCREHRWDIYLRNEGECAAALRELFAASAPLSELFKSLFRGRDAGLHELSALVSDPGAASQPIHPDSVFTDDAVMYTVFVALQDVERPMGPTIFLPGTHTEEAHLAHKCAATKDAFLSSREYRSSCVRKGDATVMDSRTLHCGSDNSADRRALLYVTVRNPHSFDQCSPPVPSGSKWADLSLNLSDFAES